MFPNIYDVYMHATPATELFARPRRDFSHGCIRVEKPVELAAWILREKPDWTPKRIREAMRGDQTFKVAIDRKISVLVIYTTAVALEHEVRFFADVYGQDVRLERSLADAYRARKASRT